MQVRQTSADRQVSALLVAAAAEPGSAVGSRLEGLAAAGVPPALVARACEHGLPGLVARRLEGVVGATEVVGDLTPHRHAALARHLTTLTDLADVAASLAGLAAPWAVVKGPVLAERAYGAPDLRSYGDLDLLVHPAAFGEALDRLEAAGAVLLDRNWALIAGSRRAELSLSWRDRTGIDLHWHVLNEQEVRDDFDVDIDAVLSRVRWVELDRVSAPTLDPVDTVWHLCLHACLSGGDRLVWLKDIDRSLAHDGVEPGEVLARARRDGTRWPVGLMLRRTAGILGGAGRASFRVDDPARRLRAQLRGSAGRTAAAGARALWREQAPARVRPVMALAEDLHRPASPHLRAAYLEEVRAGRR